MRNTVTKLFRTFTRTSGLFILFALPASSNYQLNGYGIGSGGVSDGASSSYKAQGVTGETSGADATGTTYNAKTGFVGTQQTETPNAPTFTNPSNYYNKLKLVLDAGSNPSDATYSIAISSDSFVTTLYVQNDDTVGAVLGSEDYQTYTQWGGASGFYIIGLTQATSYQVKVSASRGAYTESAYSATASAATVAPSLTFDIDIAPTDSETSPPYAITVGNLFAGTVTTASDKIWIDFDTNGLQGGAVYISGAQGGLHSAAQSYTIPAVTADLASASEGFGAQVFSTAQTSGGPLTADSPYNGSSDNVGIIDSSIRQVFESSGQITAGRGSLLLKAKTTTVTPSAADYTETFTVTASAAF